MNAISPVPEDEEIFYKQSYLQKYLNLSAKERLYLEKNVEVYLAIDELTGLIASNKRPPEVEKAIYSCAAEVIFLIDKEPTYLIIAKMLMHFSETVFKNNYDFSPLFRGNIVIFSQEGLVGFVLKKSKSLNSIFSLDFTYPFFQVPYSSEVLGRYLDMMREKAPPASEEEKREMLQLAAFFGITRLKDLFV